MNRTLLSLAFVAVLAGLGWAEDWPTFHRDAARSGRSTETLSGPALQVAWATAVDAESVDASPAVVGGRVYVGTARGKVVCLRADDGQALWQAQLPGAVVSSPAVSGDRLFVGSADRCLYALSLTDGKTLWQARTRGAVVASPLVVEGRVYCGSMDGVMRCLDARDGKLVWQTKEPGPISAAAALAGSVLCYGDESGNVIARQLDGRLAWSTRLSGLIVAAPCVAEGRLIVPVMSPTALSPPQIRCLLVLDPATGNEIWSLNRASSVLHTPVTDGSAVYFATVSGYLSDTELFAYGLADGREIWKKRLAGVADSSPALAGGLLLFGLHDGAFHAVATATGEDTPLSIEAKIFSSPAVSNGRVYFGAQDGKVYCLK